MDILNGSRSSQRSIMLDCPGLQGLKYAVFVHLLFLSRFAPVCLQHCCGHQYPNVSPHVLPLLMPAQYQIFGNMPFLLQLNIAPKGALAKWQASLGSSDHCGAWRWGLTIFSYRICATAAGFLRARSTPSKQGFKVAPRQDSWGAEPASVPGMILSGAEPRRIHSPPSVFQTKYCQTVFWLQIMP